MALAAEELPDELGCAWNWLLLLRVKGATVNRGTLRCDTFKKIIIQKIPTVTEEKALEPVHDCEAVEVQGRGCHRRGRARGSECWVHIGSIAP